MLLVVILAATTALTLGLVLHGVTAQPYEQTRQATAGPTWSQPPSRERADRPRT